jgi:hypothetical protein
MTSNMAIERVITEQRDNDQTSAQSQDSKSEYEQTGQRRHLRAGGHFCQVDQLTESLVVNALRLVLPLDFQVLSVPSRIVASLNKSKQRRFVGKLMVLFFAYFALKFVDFVEPRLHLVDRCADLSVC